jgi:hypothetical protein
MKSARNLIAAVLSIALLISLSFTSVPLFGQDKKIPTKKELSTLLKTAKEPADHLRIAAYYQQEGLRARQAAQGHAKLATIYEQTHPFAAQELKHGNSFGQGASHCKKFAELAEQRAKEADALAALHTQMAKDAEKKQ